MIHQSSCSITWLAAQVQIQSTVLQQLYNRQIIALTPPPADDGSNDLLLLTAKFDCDVAPRVAPAVMHGCLVVYGCLLATQTGQRLCFIAPAFQRRAMLDLNLDTREQVNLQGDDQIQELTNSALDKTPVQTRSVLRVKQQFPVITY